MGWSSIVCFGLFSKLKITRPKTTFGSRLETSDPNICPTNAGIDDNYSEKTKDTPEKHCEEDELPSPLSRAGTFQSFSSLKRVRTSQSSSSLKRVGASQSFSSLKGVTSTLSLPVIRQARRKKTRDSNEMNQRNGRSHLTELTHTEIEKEMILLENDSMCFFPCKRLQESICEQVVRSMLEKHQLKTDIMELTNFICTSARKAFMILAWSGHVQLIENFYNCGFKDHMLPVTRKRNIDESWAIESVTSGLESLDIVRGTFHSSIWNPRMLSNFCKNDQWLFLSPVFHKNRFRYYFHEQVRMPFVDEEYRSRKGTNFSVVEEWRIHKDHLQLDDVPGVSRFEDGHPSVAIKELTNLSPNDEAFQEAAEAEAQTLEMLIELNHPHLIKAIAYYMKGKKHYFMFPWAGLGNLRAFWTNNPPKLDPPYLKWVFNQLCGLAGAIKELHYRAQNKKSWRHGDLKPDNILCFEHKSNVVSPSGPCMLVIADVGLTRMHNAATEDRINATKTQKGTMMYEPPEAELLRDRPRSRRYDIWSIGCIYLEFIIWLLYGSNELRRFSGDLGAAKQFYIIEEDHNASAKAAKLHNMVQKWADWIRNDPRCPEGTAIHRLSELIVSKLLVMDDEKQLEKPRRAYSLIFEAENMTPSNHEAPPSPSIVRTSTSNNFPVLPADSDFVRRATAKELEDALLEIYNDTVSSTRAHQKWMNFNAPSRQGPGKYGERLAASDVNLSVKALGRDLEEYRFTPLDDNWEYAADTEIARESLLSLDSQLKWPRRVPSALCYRCAAFDLWRPKFGFIDTPVALKKRAWNCPLCQLLVSHIDDKLTEGDHKIQFTRVGSSLACSVRPERPIVSLYTLPGSDIYSSGIQSGLPQLPNPESESHIRVLAAWIRSCNENHKCIPPHTSLLPTRILDVGQKDSKMIQLACHARDHQIAGRYTALSHRWGSSTQHRKFCTFSSNLDDFKNGINVGDLPKTFRHAVQVTRSLGLQYLWIDSLCIIQDDSEDWDHESKLMEQVFSSAYLTIAATCAEGTDDGFLKDRPTRHCVAIKKSEVSVYYACDAIDDFHQHVDQSELNKRGWVLQERALSRRTIHFTEKQSYWECGGGVRCETLTKMKNRKAAFLGDANFPHSVETYVKGMKIELYQDLYTRYSTLALSFNADRPFAIRGLERRLIRTLNTIGGYGIFNIYMHRCLLWRRSGESLMRIAPSRGEIVPSWSWMAYDGGIEYMNIPYGKVSWSEDIISPFQGRGLEDTNIRNSEELSTEVEAPIWDYTNDPDGRVVLDQPERICDHYLKCVIIGTQNYLNYVLVVSLNEEGFYERVGVGTLNIDQILRDKPRKIVRIR